MHKIEFYNPKPKKRTTLKFKMLLPFLPVQEIGNHFRKTIKGKTYVNQKITHLIFNLCLLYFSSPPFLFITLYKIVI